MNLKTTQLRAAINRVRRDLATHQCVCRSCRVKYSWLTAMSYCYRDDPFSLFTMLLVVRNASRPINSLHRCRCCTYFYAKTTAELYTLGQSSRVVSAA